MPKGSGNGKTPPMVQQLIQYAVREKGLRPLSAEIGIGIAPLHRYAKGEGEPTGSTLAKIAGYFGIPALQLRGGIESQLMLIMEMICLKTCEMSSLINSGVGRDDLTFRNTLRELSELESKRAQYKTQLTAKRDAEQAAGA